MKSHVQKPYSWYVKACQDALNSCVHVSGNPDHAKTSGRNPKKIDAHITQWFINGLVQEIFNIAWDDFRFQVLDGWNGKYKRRHGIRYWSRWSMTHCYFRGHTHYVRNREHLPKGESPKQAWREHKRFQDDKVRHLGTRSQYARGSRRKQFFKKKSSASHRMWVKKNLAAGNYDVFVRSVDTERKWFADPWNYD